MRILAITCSTATLLLWSGCAHYHAQPLAPVENAARLTSRSLDDPGLRNFLIKQLAHEVNPSPASWDLQTLTLVAFYYHPSLEVARARWEVSKAELITAGGRLNPTLGLSPGYNFSAASGVNPWIPGMNFDIPIETAGKRGKRISKAEALAEANRFNLAAVAWQVQHAARASFYEVASARQREAVLRRQLTAQEGMVERLEQRQKAGAVSEAEILPLRSAVAKAAVELATAATQNVEANSRLAESLGLPGGAKLASGLGSEVTKDSPPARVDTLVLREFALLHRTDVLAALSEYAAAEATMQLEIAKQYPDIHFNPGYQYDQGEHKWSVGITAELPLLNQNQGPIAEARARRTQSAAKFGALQAKIIAEIDRTAAVYELSVKQAGVAGQMLTAQQKQQESIKAQAKAGAADAVDQLASEIELTTIQVTRLEADIKVRQAQMALEDAVQCPLDSIGKAHPVDLLRWVLVLPEPLGTKETMAQGKVKAR